MLLLLRPGGTPIGGEEGPGHGPAEKVVPFVDHRSQGSPKHSLVRSNVRQLNPLDAR